MQARNTQAGFAGRPGGGVVLPGGVSAGEGETWLLLASRMEEVCSVSCLGRVLASYRESCSEVALEAGSSGIAGWGTVESEGLFTFCF